MKNTIRAGGPQAQSAQNSVLSKATPLQRQLAAELQVAHLKCCASGRQTVLDAIKAGRIAIELKRAAPDGEFQARVAELLPDVSLRTIQIYMRAAEHAPQIEADPDIKSIRGFIRWMGDEREAAAPAEEPGDDTRVLRQQKAPDPLPGPCPDPGCLIMGVFGHVVVTIESQLPLLDEDLLRFWEYMRQRFNIPDADKNTCLEKYRRSFEARWREHFRVGITVVGGDGEQGEFGFGWAFPRDLVHRFIKDTFEKTLGLPYELDAMDVDDFGLQIPDGELDADGASQYDAYWERKAPGIVACAQQERLEGGFPGPWTSLWAYMGELVNVKELSSTDASDADAA